MRSGRDEWSDVVATRRARWETASLVNALLREGRRPATVSPTPTGWLVRSGTGRDVLADTLTGVWEALPGTGPVAGRSSPLDALVRARGRSPVAEAVLSSYGRHAVAADAGRPHHDEEG